ncbi:carboxypeptidase-like regulatory domain-containing protein [Adhaeribacter rhizoryzae]|uniref:carboxypeptidase-like regulatory domain-containing protein n=1 Tax=Adhaeribacter rhizoryzae TaxID=2607907 RepID=UPI00167FE1BE|nr:carboxypeptidase-like regulatory domain-containing protein [Adhaeribacter rhizoryzae]
MLQKYSTLSVGRTLVCAVSLSWLTLFLISASGSKPLNQEPEINLSRKQQRASIVIKGFVLDKVSNAPIPYAHILVVGERAYFEADSKGAFTLALKPEQENGQIKVSSLGYVAQEFSIADLIKQNGSSVAHNLFLVPDYKSLPAVEVNAKARKWTIKKAGYHINEGSAIHYEFYPSDTLTMAAGGHAIGNKIQLNKYPAALRSVSFGLQGLSGERLKVNVRLYSLKNNLPHLILIPEPLIIAIPPHHAGWITVNLQQYNITIKEDFAIVLEWDGAKEQNTSSLMVFATLPKGQITYYRESQLQPWQIAKSTLVDVKSIGMYATVIYPK